MVAAAHFQGPGCVITETALLLQLGMTLKLWSFAVSFSAISPIKLALKRTSSSYLLCSQEDHLKVLLHSSSGHVFAEKKNFRERKILTDTNNLPDRGFKLMDSSNISNPSC